MSQREKLLKIAVTLPAFNEVLTISKVVSAIKEVAQVIVVDDGSIDGTGQAAIDAGADLVTHRHNFGYDQALQSGLLRAMEMGFDAVITMDADGQHDPKILDSFIFTLNNGAEVVVGVRDQFQRWSERVFSVIGFYVWGLHDPLCGMKAYRTDFLRKVDFTVNRNSIGTGLLLVCARSGMEIAQLPVLTHRRHGKTRFGSGLSANLKIIFALIKGLSSNVKVTREI